MIQTDSRALVLKIVSLHLQDADVHVSKDCNSINIAKSRVKLSITKWNHDKSTGQTIKSKSRPIRAGQIPFPKDLIIL